LLANCSSSKENINLQNHLIGNTNGNIQRGGLVLINNGWIYYTNRDDNDHLYKKRPDGSENEQLVRGHYSYHLNYMDGWIYYTAGIPGEVWRIREDGTKNGRIINKNVDNLIVTEQNIFYILAYDNDWGKFFRTDIDGKGRVLLANSIIRFAIDNGWIYYSNAEDNDSLYKMDLTGENITKLNNEYSSNINVELDYVYYTDFNGDNSLYKIKTDGTDKTLVSPEAFGLENLHNGYIYYSKRMHDGRIYRMKTDGSENELIIDSENCVSLNVVVLNTL